MSKKNRKKTLFNKKFFKEGQWWVWIMLGLAFFFGLVGRFYDFNDPPLDFHPTRQLHSMLIARGMYYENLEDAPEDKRNLAVSQWKSEGQIEPPIMERLSAWGYRIVGEDDLRIPRFLSIFFWTLGGVGLYLLLKDIVGAKGAVIGVTYYLVLPFPLFASRSFQPEPLMTAAIIWSWWAMSRWVRKPNWVNAVIAGLISGFAIYIKLPALFFVLSGFVGLVLANQKFKDLVKNPQVYLIGVLAVLPAFLYHIYGLYIADFLQSQTNFRFFPDLIRDPFHYLKWKDLIDYTLGIEFFLFAIAGVLLIKRKPYRVMFLAAFIGYFLYGTAFAYHIVTHNYYQVPLTPLIAVGLAALAGCLIENLKGHKTFGLIVIAGLMFFWSAINFWDARMTLKHASYYNQPGFYQELGEKLEDYSVISITPDYGYRLGYWGWKQTVNWQSVGDFTLRELAGQEIDREAAFLNAIDNRELFLVTNFAEFDRQPEVKTFLTENFPIFEEGEGYLVFDLRD